MHKFDQCCQLKVSRIFFLILLARQAIMPPRAILLSIFIVFYMFEQDKNEQDMQDRLRRQDSFLLASFLLTLSH